MRIIVFVGAVGLSLLAFEISAFAQAGTKCKNLPTVAACVSCSMEKGGLQRFSQAGIQQWCQQQVGREKRKKS